MLDSFTVLIFLEEGMDFSRGKGDGYRMTQKGEAYCFHNKFLFVFFSEAFVVALLGKKVNNSINNCFETKTRNLFVIE